MQQRREWNLKMIIEHNCHESHTPEQFPAIVMNLPEYNKLPQYNKINIYCNGTPAGVSEAGSKAGR
jgi:hypothetical protein